ncbi:MAG: hypothetical protein ABIZ04_21665 [Opitutus sp.]
MNPQPIFFATLGSSDDLASVAYRYFETAGFLAGANLLNQNWSTVRNHPSLGALMATLEHLARVERAGERPLPISSLSRELMTTAELETFIRLLLIPVVTVYRCAANGPPGFLWFTTPDAARSAWNAAERATVLESLVMPTASLLAVKFEGARSEIVRANGGFLKIKREVLA